MFKKINKFVNNYKYTYLYNNYKILADKVNNNFITQNIKLDLSGLYIKNIPNNILNYLPHLEILDISNNYLKDISGGIFQNLINLKKLNLSNNKLKDISPLYVTSYDRIVYKTFMFNGLNNLKKLDLSKNKLKFIKEQSFLELSKLKILNLSKNTFYIEDNIKNGLDGLENLEELNLLSTFIDKINVEIFYKLKHLQLIKIPILQKRDIIKFYNNLPKLKIIILKNNLTY